MSNILIFSDGASRGNPGPGGYGVIVVFPEEVVELGGKETPTTNNRMELTGVIEGLALLEQKQIADVSATVYTDSSYVVNGITKWVYGWQNNGWQTKGKTEVLNKELWQKLVDLSSSYEIEWKLLPGHAGIPANERCDVIATEFADNKKPPLFKGPRTQYPTSLEIKVDVQKADTKSRSKAKAYSYISMIDGDIKIHRTWAECEERVKGKKGARFRKTLSQDEEEDLIREWRKTS